MPVYMTVADRTSRSIEFDLLLETARTSISEPARQRIAEYVEAGVEWEHFLFLTQYHRVTELAYQALRSSVPIAIKGEVENFLRNAAHRTVAYNMILVGELKRLSGKLSEAGIEFISFKGPGLAQSAYGNLGLRSSVDIDILIRPSDFEKLEEVVFEAGYQFGTGVKNLSPLQKKAYRHLARQMSFVNIPRAIGLDVHTGVMPPGYFYPFSFEELYARSKRSRVGGAEVQEFQDEDMVHLLCFHGVKNRWDQLKYVCDVREFVAAHPDLDWDLIMERAAKIRGERILYHGLKLASDLLGLEIEPAVERQMRLMTGGNEIVSLARKNLIYSHNEMLSARDRMRFHFGIQDTLINRSRYALYSLIRHVGGIIDI